jgi:RHS repeat-associated protein
MSVTWGGGTRNGIKAYTGREWDPETGLYYYRARYYDPKVGRFISEDPIGFRGGVNFYSYVGGNPINRLDPFGLYHYNARPPRTVPVGGATAQSLGCLEGCLQRATSNPGLDLRVSGGAETTGHSRNSHHYRGEACDISARNPVSNDQVMSCAWFCLFGAGQFEGDHWHLQMTPGNGVPPIGPGFPENQLPGDDPDLGPLPLDYPDLPSDPDVDLGPIPGL